MTARPRQRFEAVARFIRDLVAHRWVKTRQARENANPKRIYYLSMEFLIGRTLNNNMMNLAAEPLVQGAMKREGWNFPELLEEEPDAGLGNGGLGRLAACFIDSLATLQYSAMGYGLRYEYGIFHQAIRNGYQVEEPDKWLLRPDPWEIVRPGKMYPVQLNASIELQGSTIRIIPNRPSTLLGIAYDRPVVGYGAGCSNTLRLWAAAAPASFETSPSSPTAISSAPSSRTWKPNRLPGSSIPTIPPSPGGLCASSNSTSWSVARYKISSTASAPAHATIGLPCRTTRRSS